MYKTVSYFVHTLHQGKMELNKYCLTCSLHRCRTSNKHKTNTNQDPFTKDVRAEGGMEVTELIFAE